MSIKGTKKELFIGKTEINVINFWGTKKTIEYKEIEKIDYCYARSFVSGFIDFISHSGERERFCFKVRSNTSVENAIVFISKSAPGIPILQIKNGKSSNDNKKNEINLNFSDPLVLEAVKLIIMRQKASIGMIQRSLNIGFDKAVKIMDEIIETGIVDKPYGTKPFKVNITQKEFENLYKQYTLSDNTDRQFDNMSGHDFEYFCADLLSRNGFIKIKVTQGSGDHGVDILAEKDGISYAIQCKCYSGNVGNSAVQEAHTGKSIYKKDIAVVLTNRYFTDQAINEANILGVKLWNRNSLLSFINSAK
ncbi:restriction endonuclease [Enterocloster asparagiformis]|uniref:restriction endonuclease n=1 Tax=Enterocloster asparagiformis TaxID=333367 RepID=UPI002A812DD0|nr:restriction endonuclease [Enterocloster asparagiformis]